MDGQDIERMLDLVGMDYDDEEQQHDSQGNLDDTSGYVDQSSNTLDPGSSDLMSTINNTTLKHNNTANVTTSRTKDVFYGENYFDLDDILAQNQRINVKFLRNVPGLGFLDPSLGNDEADIEKGTKLELPLWIVKELIGEREVVEVTLPVGYNQEYREIFLADANCVNLNKYAPNYFRVGQHLSNMNLQESEDIAHSLIDTYTQRSNRLVNYALSGTSNSSSHNSNTIKTKHSSKLMEKLHGKKLTSAGEDTSSEMVAFTALLDNWEKELLKVGQDAIKGLKSWANRDMTKVVANQMVSSLKNKI